MARTPFPGMDPYLEAPDIWPDVHSSLANIIREQLSPQLPPNYVAELETQVMIERIEEDVLGAIPDVAVTKRVSEAAVATSTASLLPFPVRARIPVDIEIQVVNVRIRKRDNQKIVTAIEILSPVNKRPGKGREDYLEKRQGYINAGIHLIEIDLLRKWPHMPVEGAIPEADYRIIVRPSYHEECTVWPFTIRHALPVLPIPLRRPDPDVPLDLNAVLRTAYERARYDLRINYTQPLDPPLSPAEAEWAASLIAAATAQPA